VLFAACSGALLIGAIVHAAWLCDDAFITLRSVDNWVHGHGLRWNVDERVQSFTHPAWMMVLAAAYAPTESPTFALLLPALAASAAFVWFLLRAGGDAALNGSACLLLLASKAFVEFSTSGLENPLVHLLLLGYLLAARSQMSSGGKAATLIGYAALMLLTRMDLIWLIGPSLGAALWCGRRELWSPRAWLGLWPLVAWELFAIVYYGFPFPNTAYAKLATGVPAGEALLQGMRFLQANLEHDPITLPVIALGSAAGLVARQSRSVSLSIGLILWVAYLVRIGGDFMLGRLFTPGLVVAVVVLSERALPARVRWLPWAASSALVLVSAWLPRTALRGAPLQTDAGWLPGGVTDERAIFHATTGLFRSTNPDGPRSHEYTQNVLVPAAQGQRVIPAGSIGFAGYFAGPAVHIVDQFALTEPLLARLPADPAWNAGHFFRELPAGYLATLETGKNKLVDPQLSASNAELTRIVRGPLLGADRLRLIARWNLRPSRVYPFDYQVERVRFADVSTPSEAGSSVESPGVLKTGRQGLAITFDAPTPLHRAHLALGADDHYIVAFRAGRRVLWQTSLTPSSPDRRRLQAHSVSAPEELMVDSVLIRGRRGDGRYHVGALSFD
jgi:arabinofuranosyltransferase